MRTTAAHPGDMVTLEVAGNSTGTSVEVFNQTHSFGKSKTGPPLNSLWAVPGPVM